MPNLLFANANPFEAVGQYLRHWSPRLDLYHLAVISAAAVVLWAIVTWVEQFRIQREQNATTPKALFRSLCRAHRLRRRERQLLESAVGSMPASQWCDIFVNPECLQRLARGSRPEAEACELLRQRLFGRDNSA